MEYLSKRNSNGVRNNKDNSNKNWQSGLHKPMPNWERKMRQRIRKKGKIMAYDLAMVFHSGILPHGDMPTNAGQFVENFGTFITLMRLEESEKEKEAVASSKNG